MVRGKHSVEGCLRNDSMLLFYFASGFVSALFGCDDQIDTHRSRYKSREPWISGVFDRELEVGRKEEIIETQNGETDRKDADLLFSVQAANHDSKVKTGGRCAGNPRQYRRYNAYSGCEQITVEF